MKKLEIATNPWDINLAQFPLDILRLIFKQLDHIDLLKVRMVCQRFNGLLMQDPTIWNLAKDQDLLKAIRFRILKSQLQLKTEQIDIDHYENSFNHFREVVNEVAAAPENEQREIILHFRGNRDNILNNVITTYNHNNFPRRNKVTYYSLANIISGLICLSFCGAVLFLKKPIEECSGPLVDILKTNLLLVSTLGASFGAGTGFILKVGDLAWLNSGLLQNYYQTRLLNTDLLMDENQVITFKDIFYRALHYRDEAIAMAGLIPSFLILNKIINIKNDCIQQFGTNICLENCRNMDGPLFALKDVIAPAIMGTCFAFAFITLLVSLINKLATAATGTYRIAKNSTFFRPRVELRTDDSSYMLVNQSNRNTDDLNYGSAA